MVVTSETEHLGAGSECPPLKAGTLRLYSMKFCPYAERVRFLLAAKNIPYEVVNINLQQKPAWFLAKSPAGLVPVLELDGRVVGESLAICDLLDELYPQPAVRPTDPWHKARDRCLVEQFSRSQNIVWEMLNSGENPEKMKELTADFDRSLQPFQDELARRGTPFFYGDRPGMLDWMIWPWIERFPAARKLGVAALPSGEKPPPPPNIKTLHKWVLRMSVDPSVKTCLIDTKHHMKYVKSMLAGTHDYDMDVGGV